MAKPSITTDFVPVEENNITTDFKPVGEPEGTITKAPPWWMRDVVKPTMEYGGMTVGAAIPTIAGLAVPPAAAAAIPMAGAGYAVGKRGYEELESAIYGKQPDQGEVSAGQTLRDVGTGMTMEAVGQGISGLVAKGIERLVTPAAKAIGVKLEKAGIEYSLGDLYPNSRMASWIDRLMEYYPGSTDVAFKHELTRLKTLNETMNNMRAKYSTGENVSEVGRSIKKEAEALLEKYTKNVAVKADAKAKVAVEKFNKELSTFVNEVKSSSVGATKHEAGARMEVILQGTKEKMEIGEGRLWGKLDEQVGKDVVEDLATQNVAKEMLSEQMALKLGERDKGLIARLKGYLPKEKGEAEIIGTSGGGKTKFTKEQIERDPVLKGLMEEGIEPEIPTTWYGMDKTKSALLRRNREIHATTQRWDTPEQRVNEKLIKGINEDMSNHAESLGGDVWSLYRAAANTTKRIHDLYDKDMLKIMQSNPEQVVAKILQTGDKGITLLRQIKAISGEEGLVPLRQSIFSQLVEAGTKEGKFSGKSVKSLMNKVGNETLDELLNPVQRKFFDDLSNREISFVADLTKGKKKEVVNFLERISRKDDRGIAGMILQPGNDRYVYIAEKVLTKDRMTELKAVALEDIFKRNATGDILPVSSAKALKEGTGKGLEVPMKRLFRNDGTYEELREFLNMGMNMKRVEALAANTSRTAPTSQLMRSIGRFASHPVAGTAAFVSQYTLAKMYFSPTARKLMIQAWRLPQGSQAAIEAFTKANMIIANEALEQREMEK